MKNAAPECATCDDGSKFGKSCHSEPRQAIDAQSPPTIQLRASAHIAMRAWLEAEFGADELHEQRIVDAMKAIREQINLAAQQPKIVAPSGFGHPFSCNCDECKPEGDNE